MSADIVRFMDENKITMATIGGHGFGAKVATATAINNLERFTGVTCLDGGPLDHRYYEVYQELASYIEVAGNMNLSKLNLAQAQKHLDQNISCSKYRQIFKSNLLGDSGNLQWVFNIDELSKQVKKSTPDIAVWSESYGLWPGQAQILFPAYSRWVHLATNTLPIYNVFPRLQGQFPSVSLNVHGEDESHHNHWMHESNEELVRSLSQRMGRWLRWKDGAHVLLADKSEAGWFYVPDRGFDTNTNTYHGEYTPEHVHHNYLHTNEYEASRERRGKQGADRGQFLPKGQFN
jgi:pimeloyl-ACP methyl ester carboxylesterase